VGWDLTGSFINYLNIGRQAAPPGRERYRCAGGVMTKRGKLLVLLGVLVFALFNYPLLKIVNCDVCLGGIPLLIYYFFGVWLLAIIILFLGKNYLSP
jgi:hypothetical protein